MDWIRSKRIQKRISKRVHKIGKTPPYGEWRFPIMLITISGFIFILIITGTNMQVDSRTGELVISMDWSQYIEDDTGLYDPWVYDPFQAWTSQNRLLVICWMMTLYFATIAIFVCYWFKYMKWKWENVPVKEKYIEKKYKEYKLIYK